MDELKIPARDGYPLAATVHGTSLDLVWIIHSATGVGRGYYAAFARAMAERGVTVVTYDYRGIGGSRPAGSLRGFRATMTDWARKDADGVHDLVGQKYPGARVSVIGHSFGGQMLGMLENRSQARRAVFVGAQLGYWRGFALRNQPAMLFYWYFLFPVMLALLGYFPMKLLGAGEDLPGGVARQWSRWCRHPEYLFSEADEKVRQGYRELSAEVLAFQFTDDAYGGGDSVPRLLSYYRAGGSTLRTVSPREMGRPIGHFGFFRPAFRDTLWEEAFRWLSE